MDGKNPEEELVLKKKILRYMNLSWVLAMSRVSSCIYKAFPDDGSYIDKKLVTTEEADEIQVDIFPKLAKFAIKMITIQLSRPDNKRSAHWFVPLDKAVAMIGRGYKAGLFPVYPEYLVREIVQYRKDLQTLLDYNSNPLPVIFSQVLLYLLEEV